MLDEKAVKVIKIRARLLDIARSWFNQNNYIEVQGPTIIPAVGDWPGSFEIKYFDRKAYLAQGLQPYAAAFLAKLEKIYTIAPTFRAERTSDQRHLTEYWRIEVAQQCGLDSIIQCEEELISHICHGLSKEPAEIFSSFNRSPQDLAKMKSPFPRLTYDQAIDILQKDGFKVSWGQKLHWELEKHLSLKYNQPFFIRNFPIGADTFFHKQDRKKPELTLSVDLLAPEGYGEISSGMQMITEKDILSQKMGEAKIDIDDQQWYMRFMKDSFDVRSGFSIGLERIVQWICKLQNIKEATAFPRSYDDYSS
jgi:asparaginyl-tRNA synthetase